MIQIPNTLNMFIDLETNEVYKNGIKLAYADHYRLEFNNLVIKRSIEWIRHFTILNIKIHPDYVYALKFLKFKEFKPFGVSKAYNMLPIFSKPIEITIDNNVFRLLALYPNFCITKNGKLYNLLNKEYVNVIRYTFFNYPMVIINTKSVFIHKLVALAWVNNNDYVTFNVVDHIDCNKENYDASNLRWTTVNKNFAKERNPGEDKNGFVFKARNIETKKVTKFYGRNEGMKFMGVYQSDEVTSPLRQGKVWKGKNGYFEFYKISDFKKWSYSALSDISLNKLEISIGVKKYFFKTLVELKKYFNLPTRLNANKCEMTLSKKFKKKVSIKFYVTKRNEEIEVKNIFSKKVYCSNKIHELSSITGIGYNNITSKLENYDDNLVISREWLIRYKKDEPWADELNNLVFPSNFRKNVILKNIDTNEELKFSSIRKASYFTKRDQKTIVKYIDLKIPMVTNKGTFLVHFIDM